MTGEVICFNELDSPGQWNKFPNLASDWEDFLFFFFENHALCQRIVPRQGERAGKKHCWMKTCQNIYLNDAFYGFGFVKGSSGVQLAEAFLCLSRAFAHFHACHASQDVREPGLRDWSKLLYRGFAYSPASPLPMLLQQFPHPFDSHSMPDIFCLSWAVESHRHSL